jgi:acetyl esterase/lipase
MKVFTVFDAFTTSAYMDVFLREPQYDGVLHRKRPCVVLLPGGAYRMTVDREGEPLAIAFLRAGYQACVLHYSVRETDDKPILGNTPLCDAAAAIRYIRDNADAWGVDPNKIIVCGGSAGGHLAASIGIFGSDPDRIPGAEDGRCQPNAMVLSYPVISGGDKTHHESIANLCGEMLPCPRRDPWSLEKHVDKNTCPAFIWAPVRDEAVPVENSLMLASAMQREGVLFELHLYSQGTHGISLADGEVGTPIPEVATWFELCLNWLNSIGVGPEY